MRLVTMGKVKTVCQEDNDTVSILYHDKVTAGNGKKIGFPEGKGVVCCQISKWFFERLQGQLATHYIECKQPDLMICKKLNIIPVEVICRNIAAGSIVKDLGLEEGMRFDPPLFEFNLKDDAKDDPLLTPDRVKLMGYDPDTLARRASDVNVMLKKVFDKMDIDVVDFKIEFGHSDEGLLYLADEISPDSMRLWKKGTRKRFDKDLFRKGEGDIVTAYQYILDKLNEQE